MLRQITLCLLAAVLSAAAASAALAIPPPWPIDERIAQSDLVVVGEVAKIDNGLGTVKVLRVLKGPADVKEVEVSGITGKEVNRGPVAPMPQGGRPTYSEGEKLVWTLKLVKPAAPEGPAPLGTAPPAPGAEPRAKPLYEIVCFWWKEPADRADDVAGIVAAQANPAPRLRQLDEAVAPRTRLAAAYALLRKAVREEHLPVKAAEADRDAKPRPVTDGHALLDKALVDSAVEAILIYFPPGDPAQKLGPGEHTLVFGSLQRIGCPLGSLRPQDKNDALAEATEQAARERSQKYADNVRQWWQDNKDKTKLYVPKADAEKMHLTPPPAPAPAK